MSNNDPLLRDILQDPFTKELHSIYDTLLIYTGNENDTEVCEYDALLINFKYVNECNHQISLFKMIHRTLACGRPVILLNVLDGMCLSKILGVGLRGECVIVRAYGDYNAINVIGLDEKAMFDCGQAVVNQNPDGSRCFNIQDTTCCEPPTCTCQQNFEDLCPSKKARKIEAILASDFQVPQEFLCSCAGSTPVDLPLNQFRLNYVAIEAQWNLSDLQVTNNSVVMEISLIASYNPQYKYLRIRSVGAGFNPANGAEMENNSTYDRGWFQSAVNIHMQPNTDKLRTLSTEPKNVNRQTQYTTSSEFSVGVDVSKNPSFNSSYTISESTTTVVSDFNVYNNGAGVTGDWDFRLAMMENSVWDMFDEAFMKKAKVKSLPPLATKNLQAVTETVWYGANTLTDTIGVQLYWKVDHYHLWVDGNWVSYTMWYHHKWKTVGYQSTPLYIDFSSVYA